MVVGVLSGAVDKVKAENLDYENDQLSDLVPQERCQCYASVGDRPSQPGCQLCLHLHGACPSEYHIKRSTLKRILSRPGENAFSRCRCITAASLSCKL